MKKIIYMLGLGGLLLAAGCSEQEIEEYSGTEGVYFYAWERNTLNDDYVRASSLLEFGRVATDTLDLSLRVMITGKTRSYPREVKVVVDADSTTAIEGLNYEPLADRYIVEAGATYVDVPLRFFDHENISAEERRLDLKLLPTRDFAIGIPVWKAYLGDTKPVDVTRHAIFLTGFVPPPPAWSGSTNATTGVETAQWGAFSLKKFQLICELCHLIYDDFLDGITMPSVKQVMIRNIVSRYLRQRYNDRDPVLEEDGRLMWVSGVTWTSIPGVPWDGIYQ